MYAITGVTGHVGSAAARTLRSANRPIRTIARDPSKGDVVADFADTPALIKAFDGCDGAFVLLPTVPPFTEAAHRELSASIAAAVRAGSLPHVVLLSSWGADLPEGTGPVRWLHELENLLRDTGATVTAIRAPHFQEKVETVLDAAVGAGVYPVFADSADVAVPMVATRDIGEAVANALMNPPAASEIVVLEAPSYTEQQVADALAEQLGKPLRVLTIPRAGWLEALTAAAVPAQLAEELVALYAADADGRLQPHGDRRVRCATDLTTTLREIVSARTSTP